MLLCCCKTENIFVVPYSVLIYIIEFENQALQRGLNYKIENVNCYFVSNEKMPDALAKISQKKGLITLIINKEYWDAYENYPMRREALIMHELGHYPLMRKHNGNSNSLMSGENYSIIHYGENKNEMLDELFK